MCDFVDDRCPPGGDPFLAIENRGGVLGSAADAGRLDVRELFVRERADPVAEELERAPPGELEDIAAALTLLGKYPHLLRNAADDVVVVDGKTRDAQRVEPGGDRHGLLPVRAACTVRQIQLLDQHPVGHYLVVRGRGDDELAGGFVVRVIDHGQPLPRPRTTR